MELETPPDSQEQAKTAGHEPRTVGRVPVLLLFTEAYMATTKVFQRMKEEKETF